MRISYVPQRTDADVAYVLDGERIIATVNGATDTFDFSNLPNGEAASITSVLDPCPVLAARRINGELQVALLRPVPARPQPGSYQTEQEYRAALDAWKRLWTDDLEVVIGG